MTLRLDTHAAGTEDPRYREGLAHLQVGEWQKAFRCLEEVWRDHPGSLRVQQALAEARFKASLDATTTIRAKRWALPWRSIAVRGLLVVALLLLAVVGWRLLRLRLAPIWAEVEEEQRLAQLESDATALLEAGDLDAAEALYGDLLAAVPGHEGALLALQRISEEQEVAGLYNQGVALQEAGNLEEALQSFVALTVLRPNYRDVRQRVDEIRQRFDKEEVFALAEADYQEGRKSQALVQYEQLRALDVNYRREHVVERLYTLHMVLGSELLEQDPPTSGGVPQALEHFAAALALVPRDVDAALEQRLARLYLEGQELYQNARWGEAIVRLRAVYDQRPNYLGGIVSGTLYEAYVQSGDQYRASGDCGLAYERFGEAADLPVEDTALARARQSQLIYCLTPTVTPSVTPTPTPTPTSTPVPPPTPVPSETPVPTPRPLTMFRNQILFRSDSEEQPGWWVMDPDGGNRQYLGPHSRYYEREYAAQRGQEAYSPDGRYRAYTTDAPPAKPQIWIELPRHEVYGDLPPQQLTRLQGLTYDPVWAPDGSRIAFVSQEHGSDDIWVINADGSSGRPLTRNDWEWDKHPSWSPDSRRIVFWSNRSGLNQIYVTDAEGRNVVNISAGSEFAEYDPLWIK